MMSLVLVLEKGKIDTSGSKRKKSHQIKGVVNAV